MRRHLRALRLVRKDIAMETVTNGLCSPREGGLKKLAIALIGLILALSRAADGQSPILRIAYDSCSWDAYDTTGCTILTTEGDFVDSAVKPEWSPDGLRIAFSRSDLYQNVSGIFVMDLDDGNVVNLTTEGGSPSWSPDGARIAFVSWRDGTTELYVMNADGSYQTRLTHNVGFGGFEWSPDGREIAFGRVVASSRELYVVNADGSNARRVTYNVGFIGAISWSHDGRRIAFDCKDDSYPSPQICTINADGTDFARLTADLSSNSTSLFSPVDGKIAFLKDSELVVMEADGRVVRVAPGIQVWQHAWSPDGKSLAFVAAPPPPPCCVCDGGGPCDPPNSIYVVNSDGTGLFDIATAAEFRWYLFNLDWLRALPGQPVATFTYDCIGTTCQFDGAGSFDPDGTIVRHEWQFGDGSSSSGPTANHTYATLGRYDVTLIVTDAGGATDIARLNVSGNQPPIASFAFVCNGPSCTFDASGSSDPDGSITGYSWGFGDGTTSAGAVVNHTYAAVGAYYVKLFVTDNIGATSTAPRNVIVMPLPMHVGDLDGTATSQRSVWTASVTITIHDSSHALLANASVTGFWNDGTVGVCTTGADGR